MVGTHLTGMHSCSGATNSSNFTNQIDLQNRENTIELYSPDRVRVGRSSPGVEAV